MPRSLREKAEYVIDSMKSHGFEPHSQSRLARIRRVLVEANGIIEKTDPEFETAREAVRDLPLLEFVLEQLEREPQDPALKPYLFSVGSEESGSACSRCPPAARRHTRATGKVCSSLLMIVPFKVVRFGPDGPEKP